MTYSVRTPFLFWFGSVAIAFTIFLVVASWGNWLLMLGLSATFGGCGAALLLMSAKICGDSEALTVTRFHTKVRVSWRDIEKVAEGGGNLVFYTNTGRVTAPSFEFWVGPERNELLTLLQSKLEERSVPLRFSSLRAMADVGDRKGK